MGNAGAVGAWAGTGARLVLAGVWIAAGASKVGDLAESGRAVAAYRLLPYGTARFLGAVLPFLELALGVLLILGLATRLAATVSAALLAAYVVGIASAWIRGLRIDCGCFGGGGQLDPGQRSNYAPEILRDLALLALAVYLLIRPRTRLSLDSALLDSAVQGDDPTARRETAP